MTADTITGPSFEGRSDWWEYFGLRQDPFTAYHVYDDIYLPSKWEQHVDLLQLLAHHSYELLLVYGDIGSGKSTLLGHFLEQLDESLLTCRINANSQMSVKDVLNTIAGGLGLAVQFENEQNIRANVNVLLNSLIQTNERYLLVIDDTSELSNEVLSALIYLQQQRFEQQAPLAILWFLDKQAQERVTQLAQPYLEQSMYKSIEIQPFELAETQGYLKYRLQQAGLNGELPLAREDVIHIHQWSNGIPGRINNVAKKVLADIQAQDDYVEEEPSWRLHQSKIVGGVVLLIILIAGFYIWDTQQDFNYQQQHNLSLPPVTASNSQPTMTPSNSENIVLAAKQNGATRSTTSQQQAVAQMQSTDKSQSQRAVLNAVRLAAASQAKQVADSQNQNNTVVANTLPTKVIAKPNKTATMPTTVSSAKANVVQATKHKQPVTRAVKVNKPVIKKAAVKAATTVNVEQTMKTAGRAATLARADLKQLHHARKKTPSAHKANAAKRVHVEHKIPHRVQLSHHLHTVSLHPRVLRQHHRASNHNKTSLASRYNHNERYLLRVPSHEYALQLLGVRNVGEIKRFMRRAKIQNKAHYFHTTYNGKAWYVLVYGRYRSNVAAKRAIAKLPTVLKSQKPWVRSFSSIHQAIRKRRA